MAATTGSIFDTESKRIEEVLSKSIDTILPTMDPAWKDTFVTSQGVGPTSELGRNLYVNKLYSGGFTGVIDNAGPAGDFPIYGEAGSTIGNKLRLQSASSTFPDPLDGAKPSTYKLTVPMRALYTNLALSLGEMQMDATPAVIDQVIAPTLQGFAANLSHTLCNYWYMSQADFFKLDSVIAPIAVPVEASAASGSASAQVTTTITLSGKLTERFYTGQRVDVYKSDGTLRRNAVGGIAAGARHNCWVNFVDDVLGTIGLVTTVVTDDQPATTGAANWMAAIVATDIITPANVAETSAGGVAGAEDNFTGIAGINSFCKATGNLLGGEAVGSANDGQINVDTHPEFKSFFKGSVGVLTEHKLRQYLRRFHVAKGRYGQTIDCLIGSDGVWLAYEAQKIGQYMIDRTGNLSSLNSEGSQDGFGFHFEGRTYKGYSSSYIDDGVVYGIKKGGNNWKRYVPPDYSGLQGMGEAPTHVPFRFVVPALTGGSSAKWPLLSGTTGSRLTEAVQMPGMLRMQLIPDQPAGMKLSGVTTDRVFGDAS